MTFNFLNAEIPSNFSQDLGETAPPQRMLLQKVADLLGVVMSPAGQDWPVLGLKTSVALRNTSLHPPAIINPLVGFSAFMIFERFRANIDKMSCGRSVKLINLPLSGQEMYSHRILSSFWQLLLAIIIHN